MADDNAQDWVLPASIPFDRLKGRDLEECLYWLFDAMGAKDLEWRTGGSGGGAADGGRDLEAHFFTPGADNEVEPQTWWVECKGRSATVEPDEVKSAVVNAQAKGNLDCVVIATNTQFSNPTRDWVKEFQAKHPRPKIKLWDSGHLERLLSRHPEVVLRLFSEALSVDGRFKAMESRFWNKFEYVHAQSLKMLWKAKDELELSELGVFAAIVNEFANGSIVARPWGAILDQRSLLSVLHLGLVNLPYLALRGTKGGIDQGPITRAFVYLILCALDALPSENVGQLIKDSLLPQVEDAPSEVKEMLFGPIADQLLSELQDVCSSDCVRLMSLNRQTLTEDADEVETYWSRFAPEGVPEDTEPKRFLRIEKNDAPCKVGFSVDKDHGCPLFAAEASVASMEDLLMVVKRVAAFRTAEARARAS